MDRRRFVRMACALVVVTFPSAAGAQSADLVPDRTTLEQGTFGGQLAHGGDRVVFQSPVGDLVPGDSNRENDLFLHRRSSGRTVRVSVGPGGRQADGGSFDADLSGDGRWLAFCSSARNLLGRPVAVPDPEDPAIYLRDLRRRRTRMVSRHAARDLEGDPVCSPSVSRHGRFVTYAYDSPPASRVGHFGREGVRRHVRLFDRRTGRTRTLTRGADADSEFPAISPDGAAVVFGSLASNLDPADGDLEQDVFRYDVRARRIERVGGGPDVGVCVPRATASRGGRFVAFACDSVVYVHDHARGTVRGVAPSGERPLISAAGERIAFQSVDPLLPGGSPSETEVYTLRRAGGPLQRAASAPDGGHPGGHVLLSDLSGNGRWIAFSSTSTLLGLPRVSPWGDVFLSGPWR